MDKLMCSLHNRPIVVVNGTFIHRGGWGDMCKSPTATVGNVTYTKDAAVPNGMQITSTGTLKPNRINKLFKRFFRG